MVIIITIQDLTKRKFCVGLSFNKIEDMAYKVNPGKQIHDELFVWLFTRLLSHFMV